MTALRLYRSGFGLVGEYTGQFAEGRARPRVLATSDYGVSFRDVTPPALRRVHAVVEDVTSLGGTRVWVLTWNPASTRSRLYRSRDGGATWASADVPGHVAAAGSTDAIAFATGQRGWLAQEMPTGPVSILSATSDGGGSWHEVTGRLPQVAPVVPDRHGALWQAGGVFSDRLARSTDGGRSWSRLTLPGVPAVQRGSRPVYSVPNFYGRGIAVEAVQITHGHHVRELFYRSRDRGRTWERTATLGPFRTGPRAPLGPALTSTVGSAGADVWWAAVPGRVPAVYATADAGRRWRRCVIARPTAAPGVIGMQIRAGDRRHAWVLLSTREGMTRLVATDDGGRTWHLLQR